MLNAQQNQCLPSVLLLPGGIPPAISGIASMTASSQYLALVGENVPALFSSTAKPLLLFVMNLWGGDAFVAGTARVIAALVEKEKTKLWFGVVAIAHSGYDRGINSTLDNWSGCLQRSHAAASRTYRVFV